MTTFDTPASLSGRSDFVAIAKWIKPDAKVLDLGCGDGSLLRFLKEARGVTGYGVEIDDTKVLACVKNRTTAATGGKARLIPSGTIAINRTRGYAEAVFHGHGYPGGGMLF